MISTFVTFQGVFFLHVHLLSCGASPTIVDLFVRPDVLNDVRGDVDKNDVRGDVVSEVRGDDIGDCDLSATPALSGDMLKTCTDGGGDCVRPGSPL
jgi:hypothetical protein